MKMYERKIEQFVKMPVILVFNCKLRPVDIRVYLALRSYRNEKTRKLVYPSRKTIASKIGCSVDTVDRSIKNLVAHGYITRKSGGKGYSNRYQFEDVSGRMGAATGEASTQSLTSNDTDLEAAEKRLQPELVSQNHKPEKTLRLFHGKDLCSVMSDGSIRIETHTGEWRDYGGGDDASFSYGHLRGRTALKAAIWSYAKPLDQSCESGKLDALPTEDSGTQSEPPQHRPSTT